MRGGFVATPNRASPLSSLAQVTDHLSRLNLVHERMKKERTAHNSNETGETDEFVDGILEASYQLSWIAVQTPAFTTQDLLAKIQLVTEWNEEDPTDVGSSLVGSLCRDLVDFLKALGDK
jgi:hypothetical protein